MVASGVRPPTWFLTVSQSCLARVAVIRARATELPGRSGVAALGAVRIVKGSIKVGGLC